MLQSKKRITSVTLVLALLFGAFWTCPTVAAADDAYPSNALIIIGDKIITNSMTLDDVIDMFGEPKIMTDSLFGGKTCTFYGDNYSVIVLYESTPAIYDENGNPVIDWNYEWPEEDTEGGN